MNSSESSGLGNLGGYRLLAEIGRGGMGTVYKARTAQGDIVALKVLSSHLAEHPVLRQRFDQEARIALMLNHPNIVRAIEVGEDQGRNYFAMEYIEGESLGRLLSRVGRLPEPDAVRITIAIGRGLEQAHQLQLVHRDVKPDNILLTTEGEAKLSDLGLAKDLGGELNLTQVDRGLGTPNFMAPEQFKDARLADTRCDVYALAETLYTMLTGQTPFASTGLIEVYQKKLENRFIAPRSIEPNISRHVELAIIRAMEGNVERRPATIGEFLKALETPLPTPPPEERVSFRTPLEPAPPRPAPVRPARPPRPPCRAVSEELAHAGNIWIEDFVPAGLAVLGSGLMLFLLLWWWRG